MSDLLWYDDRFQYLQFINFIIVHFSISTKLSSDMDTADFNKEDGNITWSMKKLPGETECIGEFRVSSHFP